MPHAVPRRHGTRAAQHGAALGLLGYCRVRVGYSTGAAPVAPEGGEGDARDIALQQHLGLG